MRILIPALRTTFPARAGLFSAVHFERREAHKE